MSGNLTYDDIKDLPADVIEKLEIGKSLREELAILAVSTEPSSIDKIMVRLYRHDGGLRDRVVLSRKVYRMCQKGLLRPCSGKGVYIAATTGDNP